MIDAKTKIFCVIGHPIEHSLSPRMHNAVFKELNLNCIYLAFSVKMEELEDAVKGLKALGVEGFNVTMPLKTEVLKFLDMVAPEAEMAGAVNTVANDGGRLTGYNTDGIGAVRAIKKVEDLKGKQVLVLGAGGAARAICFQLAFEEVNSMIIANRTLKKGEKLAAEVYEKTGKKTGVCGIEKKTLKEKLSKADVLINATSVGMYPEVEETLVRGGEMHRGLTVMDMVYNPIETRLLREAREIGARTIDGVEMFVFQGAESLRIWLNIEPPVDLMRRIVLEELQ